MDGTEPSSRHEILGACVGFGNAFAVPPLNSTLYARRCAQAMKGAFTLVTPHDLLAKLQSDYKALLMEPGSPYLAFNFFVTAEHMLDWIFPGYAQKSKRQSERDSSVLLQVCSHLATGAKHFIAEAKHHTSVSESGRRRPWNPLAGPLGGPFVRRSAASGLWVHLDGDAKIVLGSSVQVSKLAEQVLDYWTNHKELA